VNSLNINESKSRNSEEREDGMKREISERERERKCVSDLLQSTQEWGHQETFL
jgi:hypothetical protein